MGFVPIVHLFLVPGEVAAVVEGLPTHRAQEGPLSRMDALVCLHGGRLGEAFSTENAGEGPVVALQKLMGCFPVVQHLVQPFLVPCEVTVLVESLPTNGAQVGPLSCVDALVGLHGRSLGEAFSTVMAGERLAAAVQEFVLL